MALVGFVAGCGPREPALVNPGISNVHRMSGGSAAHTGDASSEERPTELDDIRSVGGPFISRGHFAGRWKAEVWANASAAAIYANIVHSSRFPTGAVLVKKHSDTKSGAGGPVFAMAKREPGFYPEGGDWEYIVTDSGGQLEDRGKLAPCARCHAEANADWVFGLPTDAR